jgi:hypothetical protein
MPDIAFWFDPVCPFAWMTSKWVRQVSAQRDHDVEWRFISLRLLNAHIDYDAHFPPEYEEGHTTGLRMLRVAAAAQAAHGPAAVDRLQAAFGEQIFEVGQDVAAERRRDVPALTRSILQAADLPVDLAAALDDTSYDREIQDQTDLALALAGKDVGTPIIHFRPPDGVAFFGPVISRLPSDEDAVRLWDHVVGLAGFPGFAELKRSLRELPQLPALGVAAGGVGVTEDWHGGSRRQTR